MPLPFLEENRTRKNQNDPMDVLETKGFGVPQYSMVTATLLSLNEPIRKRDIEGFGTFGYAWLKRLG